jgi:hypothetical protein
VTSAAKFRAVSRRLGGNIVAKPSAICESLSRKKTDRMIAENATKNPVAVLIAIAPRLEMTPVMTAAI